LPASRGNDTVVGSEEGDHNYDCLFKFADFHGEGFDDLAARCLAIGEQGKNSRGYNDHLHSPTWTAAGDYRQRPATACQGARATLHGCQKINIVPAEIGGAAYVLPDESSQKRIPALVSLLKELGKLK
jgi:hypothetical protein